MGQPMIHPTRWNKWRMARNYDSERFIHSDKSVSSQDIRKIVIVFHEYRLLYLLDTVIFEHPSIHSGVLALHTNNSLRGLRIDDIMVIAMWAIFIALLIRRHILPKRLFTLLAQERHFRRLRQVMTLRFSVAFGAIEPQFAAGCTYRHLCIQYVFTVKEDFFD